MRKYLNLDDDLLQEIEVEQRRLGHNYFSDTVKHMIEYYLFNTYRTRREDNESKAGVFQAFHDRLYELEDVSENDYMFRMISDILYLGVQYEQMVNQFVKRTMTHFESLNDFKSHFKLDIAYQNEIISLMTDKYNSDHHIDLDLLYNNLVESIEKHSVINSILGDKSKSYSFDDFVKIIDNVKAQTVKQEDHYKVDFSSVMNLKNKCDSGENVDAEFRFVYERLSDLFILKDKLNN